MKKIMYEFLNWRTHVLVALLFATLFCLFGDSDSLLVFFLSKLIGVAFGYVFCRLLNHWEKAGKLKEFSELFED